MILGRDGARGGGSENELQPADWRAICEALSPTCLAKLEVCGSPLPPRLVEGQLDRLELVGGSGGWAVGSCEAAILGALLPRSSGTITLLDLSYGPISRLIPSDAMSFVDSYPRPAPAVHN